MADSTRYSGMTPLLEVADVDQTIDFYRHALELAVGKRIERGGRCVRARLDAGAGSFEVLLRRGAAPDAPGAGIVFAYAAEDILGLWDTLREGGSGAGGLRLTHTGALSCALSDPDGYRIAIEQPVSDVRMTKGRLIELIRMERGRMEDLIGRLDAKTMATGGVQGEWAIRDVLAHLAAWEKRFLDWLDADARGETPEMPEHGATWADINRVNERAYRENRDRPPIEVREAFRRSTGRVVERLTAIAEEDILAADRYPWLGGEPLWVMAGWSTFDHYQAHGERIAAWLTRERP